jgi:hypothetical protein
MTIMKTTLAVLLFAAIANAQCPFGGPPQPTITPEPGGWTFRPGVGIALNMGDVPFPAPQPVVGFLVVQYDGSHNVPGNTCNWGTADQIMIVVQSFGNVDGTLDERSDTFTFPFQIRQDQTFVIDLNDRWIKKIDLLAHNSAGWSGPSNSYYASPQHTGRRAEVAREIRRLVPMSGYEWRSCLVPSYAP